MTDDLVAMARLAQRDERMSTGALYGDLADRIEQLAATNEELEGKLSKSEALLARAVKALVFYVNHDHWNPPYAEVGTSPFSVMDEDESEVARTTLAELKGEDRG